jgi:hypothetical protein
MLGGFFGAGTGPVCPSAAHPTKGTADVRGAAFAEAVAAQTAAVRAKMVGFNDGSRCSQQAFSLEADSDGSDQPPVPAPKSLRGGCMSGSVKLVGNI